MAPSEQQSGAIQRVTDWLNEPAPFQSKKSMGPYLTRFAFILGIFVIALIAGVVYLVA